MKYKHIGTHKAYLLLASVLATSITAGMTSTCFAATNDSTPPPGSQSSMSVSQSQETDTGAGSTINQSESFNTSSSTSSSTSNGGSSTTSTSIPGIWNGSGASSSQSHDVGVPPTKTTPAIPGYGTFSQTQNTGDSVQAPAFNDASGNLQTSTSSDGTQSGTMSTTGATTMTQGESSTSGTLQTFAYGSWQDSGSGSATSSPSTSTSVQTSSFQSVSPDISSALAGYAVFDLHGHMLSNIYGSATNALNNMAQQFDPFAPFTGSLVVICAVNASGQPIPCPQTVTLDLHSNNQNGEFLGQNAEFLQSVVLPANSPGVLVDYVNNSDVSQFDILNATQPPATSAGSSH